MVNENFKEKALAIVSTLKVMTRKIKGQTLYGIVLKQRHLADTLITNLVESECVAWEFAYNYLTTPPFSVAEFRRFDSIICYTLPTKEQSKTFLIEYLKLFVKKEDLQLDIGCEELDNLLDGKVSYAIIKHAAQQCVKNMIINNSVTISSQQLLSALENRQKIQVGLNFHNI